MKKRELQPAKMRVRLCTFRRSERAKSWEYGLAFLTDIFGGDGRFIVDSRGNKLKRPPYDYVLDTINPLAVICNNWAQVEQ